MTAAQAIADLRPLTDLLPHDEWPLRLVGDTNTLIDNPDLAAHTPTLGLRYMAHVLPVVLGEIDDLKRSGRTPELREAAKRRTGGSRPLGTTAMSEQGPGFRARYTRSSSTRSRMTMGCQVGWT